MSGEINDSINDGGGAIPVLTGEHPAVPDACCKVGEVTTAFGLSGIDDELERRYVKENNTLHEVTAYVNNRLTAVTLDAIDTPTATEPATVRAALQGEDSVPATKRDDIRATLAGHLDITILTDAYVSHETIRRHLNEHLNVSTSRGGFDTVTELREALESYQTQYETGVSSALKRAGEKGLIDGETYRVFNTRVECGDCSETYRLQDLLKSRGCDCQV